MKWGFKIIIFFSMFVSTLSATIYEDGDTSDISRWSLHLGSLGNLFNVEESGNRVIALINKDMQYKLEIDYNNFPFESNFTWRAKHLTGDYSFYVYLNTEKGKRIINYTNRVYRQNYGTRFEIGIANDMIVGQWSRVTCNFASDLASFEADNRILSVEAFIVQGDIRIDDIESIVSSPTPTPSPTPNPSLLAFPSAEGSGAYTVGGRGGRVIEVTNLNSSGDGSFRKACESNGARTVVFRVGGTIDLGGENIIINNDNITIAGQTARGDGIQIKNGGIIVHASEVIIRYLRLRPGPASDDLDALTIQSLSRHDRQKNIIVDHVSASWAVDENIDSGSFSDNITVQWSIVAEALHDSIHFEGPHSRGIMISSDSRNITLHHNLIYRNYKRNPVLQSSDLDFVNNVVIGKQYQVFVQPYEGKVQANFVGNYFRSYSHVRPPIRVYDYDEGYDGISSIYYQDNYDEYFRPNETDPQHNIRILHKGSSSDGHVQDKSNRHPFVLVATESAQNAYISVLDKAGANYPRRDSVDSRIVSNIRSGIAVVDFVNHPSDVGGWPVLVSGEAFVDSDHDGMSDFWENTHGLNPDNAIDGNYINLSQEGYTNLEVYINSLVP